MATKKVRVKATALKVQSLTEPGRHWVDNGLFLQIDKRNLSKSWVFRYRDRSNSKLKSKGIGGYPALSLAEARKKADGYRMMLHSGTDPIQTERAKREANKTTGKLLTFGDCARAYVNAHKPSWRNTKHHAQWENTLATYAAPLMKKPIAEVTKADILACLNKDNFWQTKTETATRVRQRIETVMDYAKASDLYTAENPARWRGNLKELLPAPGKLRGVRHHPALPYTHMGEFMDALVGKGIFIQEGSLSAKALALLILTGSRISEVVGAKWGEFDLTEKLWTVPASRMKAGRIHTVPLSDQAIKILKALHPKKDGFVFPGESRRKGKPTHLSDAAPRKFCKELVRVSTGESYKDPHGEDITIHGFRSTFRDWAADMTAYPREVAEASIAHVLSDKTEAAYRRSDLLGKRARLIADWGKYCFKANIGSNKLALIGRSERHAAK